MESLSLAVIYLGLLGVPSAQASCSAQVEVESIGPETEVVWAIEFSVRVDDCRWSSGSFEFEVFVADEQGARQASKRRESWVLNDSSSDTTKHRMQLTKDESLDEAEVLERTVECTCRAEGGDL